MLHKTTQTNGPQKVLGRTPGNREVPTPFKDQGLARELLKEPSRKEETGGLTCNCLSHKISVGRRVPSVGNIIYQCINCKATGDNKNKATPVGK